MIKARLISCLQSKVFTGACYAALVVLGGAYAYQKYTTYGASNRELNISCFAYRDINRNGIYDLADRPYAGLKITMNRPNGDTVSASSNIGGFTNFKMGYRRSTADIVEPGPHVIRVIIPQGWKVTSGNAVQTGLFARLEGAPAGIVATQPFVPVGVAPDLAIIGIIAPNQPASPRSLRAISPKGVSLEVPVSASGEFSFPAEAGPWTLTATSSDGRSRSRTVLVKDYPVVVSKFGAADPPPPAAPGRRQKVDFDSLTSSDTLYEIPNGYAGLNWTNWVATHQKLYGSDGTINGAISSEYVAYNSSGLPATIGSDKAFDLAGVFLSVAWPDAEKHDIVIKAWSGDRLTHEDRLRSRTWGPIYLDADYRNVTRLEFSSAGFWQVVIDDLEIRRD